MPAVTVHNFMVPLVKKFENHCLCIKVGGIIQAVEWLEAVKGNQWLKIIHL